MFHFSVSELSVPIFFSSSSASKAEEASISVLERFLYLTLFPSHRIPSYSISYYPNHPLPPLSHLKMRPIIFLQHLLLISLNLSPITALSAASWRAQSIYQVITDRFAHTDGSTTASCNVNEYCGGTWKGIVAKLDYIQSMGFTAVSIYFQRGIILERKRRNGKGWR